MKIYDILVKSLDKADYAEHLRVVFGVLRHRNIMLNLTRCAFGVGSKKFFGPHDLQERDRD